jgi:ferredoxin-NADP reductase
VATAQKIGCVVEEIVDHGGQVYTVTLRPERPAPRFRAGQFLHLALDPYDPTGFWPESRVFSIASSPSSREAVRITYAVHGAFTARMERELTQGGRAWIKMPYGDFVIEPRRDVVLFAGGTGRSAFTAFLEALPSSTQPAVVLGYGARTPALLIYRDVVERAASRVAALDALYFVEQDAPSGMLPGRLSVQAIWPHVPRPLESDFYISGPPAMLKAIGAELRAHDIAAEAIHIDAWE